MRPKQRIVEPVIVAVALRNLIGHFRRTLLTISAIAAGLSALIFLWGFNDGLHRNILSNFQDAIIGSLQIHQQGFFEHPRLALYIKSPERVVQVIEGAGVSSWSRRLETFALATSEKTTEGVMLIGMEPKREAVVTRIKERIGKGRFLQSDDEYSVILGATTAKNLQVKLGDPVVMVGYDRYGALGAEEFTLVGIITSGEMGLDRGMALTSIGALQQMLDMPDGITGIALKTDKEKLTKLSDSLSLKLADDNLEVMTWSDMFPVVQEWITLHNGFLYLFVGIVLFIVLAGELNTLLLSMLERTREFGIFMAIGTTRRQIGLMLLLEAVLLGVVGAVLGILFGIAIILVTGRTGIDLSYLLGSTSRFYVDPIIYPKLNLDHIGITIASVLLASFLAGLYPAWRATRLQPVEAIRNG